MSDAPSAKFLRPIAHRWRPALLSGDKRVR